MSLKELFSSSQKRLSDLEFSLKKVSRDVKNIHIFLDEQKSSVNDLINEVRTLHQVQKNINLSFQDALSSINNLTIELSLFKPSMQQTILNKTTSLLEQELAIASNKISAEVSGFSLAKKSFKEVVKQVKSMESEILRLQELTKSIEEKDFDLQKYAFELDKNDRQKLELMKRVDDLERMLAKMKRDNI
jgi:hypothetical protein